MVRISKCDFVESIRKTDQDDAPGALPMRPQDYSEVEDWPGYFESVKGKGARETLIEALELFSKEGFGNTTSSQEYHRLRV